MIQTERKPATLVGTQKRKTATRTRLRVTTCLYRNLNNRARSLSTLIVVNVNMDTTQNIPLIHWDHIWITRLRCRRSNKAEKITATVRGWPSTPTPRSVIARERSNSFDAGFREVSLWRASRIKLFPIVAVIVRTIQNDAIEMQWRAMNR